MIRFFPRNVCSACYDGEQWRDVKYTVDGFHSNRARVASSLVIRILHTVSNTATPIPAPSDSAPHKVQISNPADVKGWV